MNRLVILAKHGSMMLAGDCDFIQVPPVSVLTEGGEKNFRLSTMLELVTPTGLTGSWVLRK